MSLKWFFLLPLASVGLALYTRAILLCSVCQWRCCWHSIDYTIHCRMFCFPGTPVPCDSQECSCISRCPLEDGTTERKPCSGISPLVTWFIVVIKLSLRKYSILPYAQPRSENMKGSPMGRETFSVLELSLLSWVELAVKYAGSGATVFHLCHLLVVIWGQPILQDCREDSIWNCFTSACSILCA